MKAETVESKLRKAKKKAANARRHLRNLTSAVDSVLKAIDTEMKVNGSSAERSKRLALICKAIERRAKHAYHVLLGTSDRMSAGMAQDEPMLPIGWINLQSPEIQKALHVVRDELYAILEMASAELGTR